MLENLPAPNEVKGRYSDGMCRLDWENIALAWETWHTPQLPDNKNDAEELCQVLLSPYGLWDNKNDEPNLTKIRDFYIERC